MLSGATFVHSVWHFGCNSDTKTKQWRRVGQSGRSGFMSTALWQCRLAWRWFNLCFNKQQIFGRFPRKQTWPAVECCSSSAVDLRFCWSVPPSGAVSGWSLLLLCQKATKERTEDCSTAASQSGCVQLRSIERARYATKHVRDTDSDYVMEKPSRCWLGALPRYWKAVASCFQFVSFVENTFASLAPRACIFQPILLLFFLFSCSWICLQNGVSDFLFRLKI